MRDILLFSEWFEAADKMLLEECKNIDVIITTALIPGRKAPVLIKKHHVEAMPSGGVTVDLAAASGGNVETTVAGVSLSINYKIFADFCAKMFWFFDILCTIYKVSIKSHDSFVYTLCVLLYRRGLIASVLSCCVFSRLLSEWNILTFPYPISLCD